MASATCRLSEQQFRCCICLDVFTDPAALPCGHNFCKACIERNWRDTVVYKCPYCKQLFHTRPELKVNIFIAEMSAQFRESMRRKDKKEEPVAEPGEIACDVCEEGDRLKAQKSCLVCLTSYCASHLRPHRSVPALRTHLLVEPQRDLQDRACPEHGKALQFYCKSDETCVCEACAVHHNGHEVVPLSEASEEKKLQLMQTKEKIGDLIQSRSMKILELRRTVESPEADKEMSEGLRVFTELKKVVDRALENLFHEIGEKQAAAKTQAEAFILELEKEILELNTRMSELEQISQSDDHLRILQNFKPKRSRIKNWSKVTVSTPSFEGTVATALSKLEEEFSKITKEMLDGELRRVKKFETLVTLDGDTAHPQLVVSQNGAQVNYSIEQRQVRNSSSRFEDFYVLGKQGFLEDFYFEAEVKGKTEWTLGVAKQTVNRKGSLKLDPQNGVWAIALKEKKYVAGAHQDVLLSLKAKPEKVGVFVNYGEGRVSFYDVENAALIHSFSGFSFRENLHPICSPGRYFYGNLVPVSICQNMVPVRRRTLSTNWSPLG